MTISLSECKCSSGFSALCYIGSETHAGVEHLWEFNLQNEEKKQASHTQSHTATLHRSAPSTHSSMTLGGATPKQHPRGTKGIQLKITIGTFLFFFFSFFKSFWGRSQHKRKILGKINKQNSIRHFDLAILATLYLHGILMTRSSILSDDSPFTFKTNVFCLFSKR